MSLPKKIVLATRNKGKIRELRYLLSQSSIQVMSLDDYLGIPPIEENGSTFEENAVLKARTVADYTGLVAVADDSGLEVDALGGRPGVYSARFAGPDATDSMNNRKVLDLLRGIPLEARTARFQSVVAVALPQGKIATFKGTCEGLIAFEPRGHGGFGYDPIFIVPELDKHMAELSMDEKNRISHRSKALALAKPYLLKLFGLS